MLFAVVAIIAAADSETRSVVPAYRLGSERFFAGQPLYDLSSLAGYVYAPAFAVIFAPFWLAGPLVGGLIWRAIGFAVLSFAVVLQVRRITDEVNRPGFAGGSNP